MRCIKCNEELELDDNFCPKCGELTPHGYVSLKNKPNEIKYRESNLGSIFTLVALLIIVFTIMTLISGKDIFRPYIEIKKQIYSLKYGYKISLINTDNQYTGIVVNTNEEAIGLIKEDIIKESWQCRKNINVALIEKEISENYHVSSVSLCDVYEEEALKIKNTIDKVYNLFPNIKGYLTNITITNANIKDEYIAYFEPAYTFVNSNSNIEEYNKVNKTQILLNSYYFLNKDIINRGLKNITKDNWYPEGATFESLIAHELGHYITFVSLLKENNIDSITLITKDNYEEYQNIIKVLNNGSYSQQLVDISLNNYNQKYNTNITLEEFSSSISGYASQKKEGSIIYDEVIAEAVHDYYLHENSSSKSTIEIINTLKERLI